ncbi:MAG: DUF6084 family protein [Chthoniobacterales bacterium]
MPELSFKITGVEPANRGLVPLLHFKCEITNQPPNETIQSVMLQAQIQIASPQRAYNGVEKEKLKELFGTPDQWGNTLRNKLWTLSNTVVRTFTGQTEAMLSVPCSYDLNVAATKYFYALEEGEVPLLFLFSGTIFYAGADGRLQVQQINWNCESTYRMPITVWQELMDFHYPNSAWVSLDRETFDRLLEFKRNSGVTSWEQAIERLLGAQEKMAP